jgi:LacI family transcriptional regulator
MQMVSIKYIALKSGYSVATVSRFINNNGYISEKAAQAIERAIQEYDYKPNYIARNLVTKKTNIIGLIIPSLGNPFLIDYVQGVEKEASKHGYNIFLCHSQDKLETQNKYLKLLLERRVDGILLFPVLTSGKMLHEVSRSVPLLTVVRKIEGISSITVDDYNGSYNIVEYLILHGHKRIAFVNGLQDFSTGVDRWRGAQDAAAKYNITINKEHISFTDYNIHFGYECTLKILQAAEKPTAVYAASHLLSLGAMKAINEMGYKIPDDISLVSFDVIDRTYDEYFIQPRITTNINHYNEMGTMAIKEILDQIVEKKNKKIEHIKPRNVVIALNLDERESVKSI